MLIKPSLNAAALSGVIATFPMSAYLVLSQKFFEKYPSAIPPEQVTGALLETADVDEMDQEKFQPIVWSSHFAYGMAAGSFYSLYRALIPKSVNSFQTGASFGLLVWATSYWGWLPALKLLPPPPETEVKDNVDKIVSHIIWGAALGLCYQLLESHDLIKDNHSDSK